MANVAVTGAGGSVGRQAVAALEDEHAVTPLTFEEVDGLDGEVIDVREKSTLVDAFDGQDVVVHLAADPSAGADWDSVLGNNIDGTYNVYDAACEVGVERVVFASTNHLTAVYNAVDGERGTTAEPARVVAPDDPPKPDSYYGVSKITGEALGEYYAWRHEMEVVNFRIGWLRTRDQLREELRGSPEHARFARALWLSPRDCRQALRRAATVDLPESPLTVHVTSDNSDRYLTLAQTIQGLGYRPRDDSADVEP